MAKKTGVMLSQLDWAAIVRFFRKEEAVLRDSYGEPQDKEGTWRNHYQEKHPQAYRLYERVRQVIEENSR